MSYENKRESKIKEAERLVASLRDNPDAEFIVAVGGSINDGKGIGLGVAVGMSLGGLATIAAWIFRTLPLKGKKMLKARFEEEIKRING